MPETVYILDFRKGVVEQVSVATAMEGATELPPDPPGITYGSFGTPPPPRVDESESGSA